MLTVSKSMEVNLKSRRKKGGIRILVRLWVFDILAVPDGDSFMLSRYVVVRCGHALGTA